MLRGLYVCNAKSRKCDVVSSGLSTVDYIVEVNQRLRQNNARSLKIWARTIKGQNLMSDNTAI
jgi:hypothetical protein